MPTFRQDYVICIAALHHLASWERRLRAVCEMGRVLRPGGLALIFVWALEQSDDGSASSSLYRHQLKYLQADNLQDVLVPWKQTPSDRKKTTAAQDQSSPSNQGPPQEPRQPENDTATKVEVSYRFYHLFRKGELEQLLLDSGLFVIDYAGYDRDNWYCCVRRL